MNKVVLVKRIFIIVIAVLLVTFIGYLIAKALMPSAGQIEYQKLVEENPFNSSGTIEGSLTLPKDDAFIEDILVCAKEIENGNGYCTAEFVEDTKYESGKGYKLELPNGKYNVYALYAPDNKRAYYSEYVLCGQKTECPSHTPIEVRVEKGKLIQGIDPVDWDTK